MKIIRISIDMFKERTQSDDEWKNYFNTLNFRIDEALRNGDHELAERLDVELEEFLENAELYLSEVEEGDKYEDLEPDPGDGVHYVELLAPLYEEYLMAKKGEDIHGRFLGREQNLENRLAYYVLSEISETENFDIRDYLVLDGSVNVGHTVNGKPITYVNEFKDEVKSDKVKSLVDLARNIWKDKVKLIRKLNPNWSGYHGYLDRG